MTWLEPTYTVSYLAGGQLKVASTPGYLFSSLFLLLGLVPALYSLFRIYRSKTLFPAWGFLFCLPWFFFASVGLRIGSLTLNKNAGTALFHRPTLLGHHDFLIDLRRIRYAEIRSKRATTYIAIILDSGPPLTFADSTDADGQDAMEAINRYLGVSGRPVY